MSQPLPVDVVSTPWDYFVDTIGVLSGLGTMGALIVAALAYSRQVDDALRQQALKISIKAEKKHEPPRTVLNAANDSDQPILMTSIQVPDLKEKMQWAISDREYSFILFAHDSEPIAELSATEDASRLYGFHLLFIDAGGRKWERDAHGTLVRMSQKPFERVRRRREVRRRSLG